MRGHMLSVKRSQTIHLHGFDSIMVLNANADILESSPEVAEIVSLSNCVFTLSIPYIFYLCQESDVEVQHFCSASMKREEAVFKKGKC